MNLEIHSKNNYVYIVTDFMLKQIQMLCNQLVAKTSGTQIPATPHTPFDHYIIKP